ncbi:MAG: hypothetical protein ABI811_08855 [Acidobacteriota bacterium]
MLWLLVFTLALDLGSVKSEPKLEKRSELALQYANTAIDAARTAYQDGRFEQTEAALGEVKDAVALSYDSLLATGKNPRKSSGPFKNAEKATRELLRRLAGLRDLMSSVDHSVVDPVVEQVTSVHNQLLEGIMTGNK